MFDDADAIEDGATTDKACEKNTLGVVHKSPTQRDIHLKIKRCCKSGEDMMSVPSTGHDGQDGGGVYQTGRSGDIANLIKIIEPIFKRLQQDFPTIKKIFLDAGCGQHKPGVQFALEGEYRSIGLEIDTARCAMAAHFLQTYWENTLFLKLHYSTRILQYQAIGRRWLFSIFGDWA
jgi:hypothetical protein